MKNVNIKSVVIALTLIATLSSCENDYQDEKPSIAAIAVANENFSTLEGAAIQGGVAGVLSNSNPNDPSGKYTVFAPTNAAFAKLPAGTVEFLLKPENKATLAKILTYHVVAGSFNAGAVVKAIKDGGGSVTLKTVSGGNLVASIKEGKVILTDEKGATSTVVATDLTGSNGLIHVVDAVVLPK